MKRKLLKYFFWTIGLLLVAEISLRIFLDNEQRVLYEKDEFCEYKLQPNQNVTRFHNSYRTNSYGMRSDELRKSEKKRILLFGDSVLNGGTKVDQNDIINYILKSELELRYKTKIGTYNVSSGSWGPENAFRYFENYVDFDFDLIILLFGSEDYHDNMHFRDVVGVQPAWPNSQPYLALSDFFSAYIMPKINSLFGSEYNYLDGFDDSKINPGWDLFINYAIQNNKELIVYYHPDKNEVQNKTLSNDGAALTQSLLNSNVDVINGIEFENETYFLDNIHINANGHNAISKLLFDKISNENLLKF